MRLRPTPVALLLLGGSPPRDSARRRQGWQKAAASPTWQHEHPPCFWWPSVNSVTTSVTVRTVVSHTADSHRPRSSTRLSPMLASLTNSSAGLLLLLQRPDSGSINSGTATVGNPRSGPAETIVGRSLSEGDDCYTGKGADYRGTAAVDGEGIACSPWQSVVEVATTYPNAGLEDGEGNYCRNPDRGYGPWCYTVFKDGKRGGEWSYGYWP